MHSLKDKVVVITGGSAGLGRATARAFARKGCKVAILARGEERVRNTEEELQVIGAPKALGIVGDVADPDAVDDAADRVETELGPIDIWVNNAMTTVLAPLKDMTPVEFRRVTEVTYFGVVYGTMSALRKMQPRGTGKIIQVGSALAVRSIPLQSAYCGAKHAIRGFTDSLRSELIHDGSRIELTMVQMPALNTPQFRWVRSRLPRKAQPVPPIFQPEVGADAIVWAATHRRRELYVGASTLEAILGQKCCPKCLDKVLAKRAYKGQQTSEAADPNQPDNLHTPIVNADIGAHGVFDARAQKGSWQLWLSLNRKKLLTGALAALSLAGVCCARTCRCRRS